MAVSEADLSEVLELERELQSPSARSNQARVRELLDTTFIEIGASGRCWDFETTVATLPEEARGVGTAEIGITGLTARALCDDVVQVFWDSDRGGRRARRTSLWQRRPHGWQQTYHQGTLLP